MDYSNIPSNNPQSSDFQKKDNVPEQQPSKPRQSVQFKVREPKKSKFAQIFLGAGDKARAKEYVTNTVIPNLKYFLFSNGVQILESFFFKDIRYSRGGGYNYAKVGNYDYSKNNQPQQQTRAVVSSALRFDFSDIIFENRADAVNCLRTMDEIIENYNSVSVGDLLDLVGRVPNKTDWTYVWYDLSSASTREVMGGCILVLPEPKPLR